MGKKQHVILVGHVLDQIARIPDESVSCCVTSPPYWSLRKYDAPDVVWGGDRECPHTLDSAPMQGEGYQGSRRWQASGVSHQETPDAWVKEHISAEIRTGQGLAALGERYRGGGHKQGEVPRIEADSATCSRCGAWRGQLGLEPTPEMYVEHTLEVLRAIRRVLRPDGVVWWNIGDGYSGGARKSDKSQSFSKNARDDSGVPTAYRPSRDLGGHSTLKDKDLVLMPERVALALQADGWFVRSRIAWTKKNSMPESAKDRPSNAWEHIYMLTKNARYWFDAEAVREPAEYAEHHNRYHTKLAGRLEHNKNADNLAGDNRGLSGLLNVSAGRNLRNVWEFPTAQTPEAHFATFPLELPRRAILASCPPEICAKCGTARVRMVETKRANRRGGGTGANLDRKDGGKACNEEVVNTTIGWTSCACDEPKYRPGIVLDPFLGIGTTGIVALRLKRRFIGVELSPKYASMARKKLSVFWKKFTVGNSSRTKVKEKAQRERLKVGMEFDDDLLRP